ncbi:MAG: hypothetical protein HXX19_19580 [Rhodoferax sp.]|nr:hypothetical protein [Rhodoferax sp.]
MILPALAWSAPPILTTEGYGAVRFGMPIAAAEKAMGQRTRYPRHGNDCQYVRFRKYPGIYFMVENGVVVRADTAKNLRNSAGVRMGMDIATFKAEHPQYEIEVQDIDGSSVMYLLKSPDQHAALVLFAVDGKVLDMWAGIAPAYTYDEGCE